MKTWSARMRSLHNWCCVEQIPTLVHTIVWRIRRTIGSLVGRFVGRAVRRFVRALVAWLCRRFVRGIVASAILCAVRAVLIIWWLICLFFWHNNLHFCKVFMGTAKRYRVTHNDQPVTFIVCHRLANLWRCQMEIHGNFILFLVAFYT